MLLLIDSKNRREVFMENVLFIYCDQLRADALSCYGDPNIKTPNIDSLAMEGVQFTNAVATAPLCCPARANVLTGLYNTSHTVQGHEDKLVFKQPTIADAFNQNDYETIYLGKWHLDGFKEVNGLAREHITKYEERGNFDTWIGYENNNSPFNNVLHGHRKGKEIKTIHSHKYEVDLITDMCLEAIESVEKDNFFMWINYQPPHNPYISPAEYMAKSNSNIKLRANIPASTEYREKALETLPNYYSMIKNIDDNVGRIIEYLRENNLFDSTHIVFSSDHGDMHQSHGCEFKTNYFEESLKVPLIVGGTIPFYYKYNCGKTNQVIGQSDIAPTLCGLAGIEYDFIFEGTDFSSIRVNSKMENYKDYTLFGLMRRSLSTPSNQEFRGIMTNDNWKYVVVESGPIALYNLNNDKYEQANLLLNPNFNHKRRELHTKLVKELEVQKDYFIKYIK